MSYRILTVGDCHVRVGENLNRFRLLSNLIQDTKPDHIVLMGDFMDMDCLSRWDRDKRMKMEGKRYKNEILAGNRALDELTRSIEDGKERARKRKEKMYDPKLVFIEGNHCLSTNHELLTEDGWKSYYETVLGDRVLTMLPDGTGEWNDVEDIIIRDNPEGYLHVCTNEQVSLECTPGHRVYYRKNGKESVTTADKVSISVDVPVSTLSNNLEYPLDDDWIRLAAWLCTDSHFSSYGVITLYQSQGGGHVIRNLLTKLGIEFNEVCRDRAPKEICGRVLKSHKVSYEFKLNTKTSLEVSNITRVYGNKRLPDWAMCLSNRQFDIFLETLIFCGGCDFKGERQSCRVFYGKEQICSDVQAVAVAHGWRASLREYRCCQYRVNLSKKRFTRMSNLRTTTIPYDDIVWCISVKNNNFVTRCDGNVHVTGNCERLTRYLEYDPTFEGHVSIYKDLHLKERGFEWVNFREYHYINDIGFTHVPHDKIKPISGVDITKKAQNVTIKSCVFGHVHELHTANRHIEGQCELQQILSVGCFIDYEFDYVHGKVTNYWKGVIMLDSYIPGRFDITTYSLGMLERVYG